MFVNDVTIRPNRTVIRAIASMESIRMPTGPDPDSDRTL
jgi:hypothetical protein